MLALRGGGEVLIRKEGLLVVEKAGVFLQTQYLIFSVKYSTQSHPCPLFQIFRKVFSTHSPGSVIFREV